MNFEHTTEQRQIRDMIASFTDKEIKPRASEIDRLDAFPHGLIDQMADLGLLGMPFPERFGGAGLDYHAYVIGLEEISRGSGAIGTAIAAHTSLAGTMLFDFGSDAQRTRHLMPMNEGKDLGAFALSESVAGSDVAAMQTVANAEGDDYVLTGGKLWVSNGSIADTIVVFAKTDPSKGRRGITAFVVRPAEDKGFHIEGTERKLGDKGCPTAELRFDHVRISKDRRIGSEGAGFEQALKTLNGGRITIAARGIGIARAALNDALSYAKEREQFDRPIVEFQTIQHKLADMDTKIRAAQLLMHDAVDRKLRDKGFVKEAAQAKLFASEISREVTNEAIQIHGGYGYTTDFAVERYYRDAKLNEIYEGTSEILRNTIAKQLIE